EIVWNGRRIGARLPAEFPVLAGGFAVDAALDCFAPRGAKGRLEKGEKQTVKLELERIRRKIRVETATPGFEVFLDGASAGVTSAETEGSADGSGALTTACLPPGDHALSIRRPCYESVERTVEVDVDLLDGSPV